MSVARRQRTVKIGLFLTNRINTFCAFSFFQTNTRAIGAEKKILQPAGYQWVAFSLHFFTFFKSYAPCVGADPRVCPFEWTVDLGSGRHGSLPLHAHIVASARRNYHNLN